jgi:hypothetical protein
VIPSGSLRVDVLDMIHSAPWAAHIGRRKTLYIAKEMLWWPRMQEDIDHYIKHCDSCQRNKAHHQNAQNSLVPLPVPEQP